MFRSVATAVRAATRPGSAGLRERLACLPRLVRAVRSGAYPGTTLGRLALLVAAALYVVSPADLLPEALLPLLGLADDALVVTWVATTLVNETEAFLRWERARSRTVEGTLVG